MSFFDEIRKQPRHHRELMFGLSVVTAMSLVGMVWYNSFEKDLYTLLNPGESMEGKFLAENKPVPSLFGNISQTGKDLMAGFYGIFSSSDIDLINNGKNDNTTDAGDFKGSEKVYKLPVSEKK